MRLLRPLLLLLLAVVLPLKSVAAAVVPITGAPDHRHAEVLAGATHAHDDRATHEHCDARASSADQSGSLHEHSCPHLAMALIAPCAVVDVGRSDPPRAPKARAERFDSVVLDVPRPPPTVFL